MSFLIPSFIAGILTALAPCVISVLPIILGGTVGEKHPLRPVVIVASLGVSVILFTLLLKATTLLIDIPTAFWRFISGGLILLFGFSMMFPHLWARITVFLRFYKSEKLLEKSREHGGLKGAVLLGAALGPVFTSCSPTYALILAIALPASFAIGLLNLVVYTIGLIIPLLLIGYGGQKISAKFRFAANPYGWIKRSLGVLLVVTGIAVLTHFDRYIETAILEAGYLGGISIEEQLLERFEIDY